MLLYKPVIRGSIGKWIIACLFISTLTISAHATPSPGVAMSDQIVGTTSTSFFVIRTTSLRPPSYYEYRKRVELVQLSIETGHIERQCLVRETEYEFDHDATQETWEQTELAPTGCHVFEELSKAGANYIEPDSIGPHAYQFILNAEGIHAQETEADDKSVWTLLLSSDKVKAKAAKITAISTSSLLWQTGDDPGEVFSVVGSENDFEQLHEACELRPAPAASLRLDWLFFKLVCWPGSDDVDGANFYVPINASILNNEME